MQLLNPAHWKSPKGYANGVSASGRMVFTGGVVGWDEEERFPSDFIAQVHQALSNIVTILAEGDARPEHLVRMTWYITDKQEYLSRLSEMGEVYRSTIGRHFPAMTMVVAAGLIEDEAKLEIEATAVVPE